MRARSVHPAQLSLWAEEDEEASAPDLTEPAKKWYTLDEIIVRRERWADEEDSLRAKELLAQGLSITEIAVTMGYSEYTIRNFLSSDSTSPAQLERLAMMLLGETECSFVGNDGTRHYYRCISTGIVDGQVLAAYQYDHPARSKPLPPLEKDEVE